MKKDDKSSGSLKEGQIIESPQIRDRESSGEDSNRSSGEGTPIYLTSDSTLQSPEEHQHDKSVDATLDETREVSNDDLHDIKAGKITGRDDANDDGNNE